MKNNIRVQRAIHRLTQQDVADKIGVSRQTINAMELGKYIPSTLLALRLAQLFQVAVEEIFSLEESDARD